MMERSDTKNLQEQLSLIGLTEYEVKVYIELINNDKLGATNISKNSGVSRGRIYEVLDNLINKGFCKIIPGATKSYKAVAPEVAIDNVINEMKNEMQLKEMTISEASKNLQIIYDSVNEDVSTGEHVQILTSQSAITERIRQLQFECQNILRVFVKAPILMDHGAKDSANRMKEQMRKKMKMKQIYEYDKNGYKEFAESVINASKKGADFEVRISMKLPLKLVVFDDNHALFTLNRERRSTKNYSMMSVSHTYLTVAMIELFEFYWEVAIPLKDFIETHPID
jgi:HTH-type transcriptional regulator, sugar sensing transcriptional regulator